MKSNNAPQGGGIYGYNAVVDLEDSHLLNNSATQSGGGIYIDAPSAGDFAFNLIGQIGVSTFSSNKAAIGGKKAHLKVERYCHVFQCCFVS